MPARNLLAMIADTFRGSCLTAAVMLLLPFDQTAYASMLPVAACRLRVNPRR